MLRPVTDPGPTPALLVDCDPGIDDAVALLLAPALAAEGKARLAAVVAVAGNMPVSVTARNAACVVDRAGLEVPVLVGMPGPDPETHARRTREDAERWHGVDGLAGLYRPGHPSPVDGGIDAILGLEPPAVVLATGPLTDLAAAIARDPGLPGRIDRVVVMGGAFGDPPGNMTPFAEFNWWADPAAADRVCRSAFALDVVPLDVTRRVRFTLEDAARLDGAGAGFAAALLRGRLDLHAGAGGPGDGVAIHDAVAAALLGRPDLADWRAAALTVDVEGPTAGRAVMAGREPSARVALDIDEAGVHEAILTGLEAWPRS